MAMNPAHIPLGHLYSNTPVPKIEYSPEQDEMLNLLFNKEQYASDRQAQEAAALTAKVNIDKIRPELQGLALRDIDKHQKDLRLLYGDKLNRRNLYNLNTEGKAKVSLANTALLGRIGALEQFTKDAEDADKRYYALLANGNAGFTMEDYQAVRKEWEDKVRNASSINDVPWLSRLTQQKIEPKIKQMDALKVRNRFEDEVVSQMSGVEYTRPTVQGVADFIKTRYPESNGNWNEYRNSLELSGIVDPKDDYQTALDKAATALRPSIKPRLESKGVVVNNYPNGFDNNKGVYVIPFVSADGSPMLTYESQQGEINKNTPKSKVVMNLEAQGKAIPWVGRLRNVDGKWVNVEGTNTQIIQDNHDGLYMRIQGTYKDENGDAQPITQDVPYTLDYRKRLHQEKVAVDELNKIYGSGHKSTTKTGGTTQSGKTYSMAAALKKYTGYTESQIRERMSQLGYKEVE